MTNEELIADFFAKGGRVTKCAYRAPAWQKGSARANDAPERVRERQGLREYRGAFEALSRAHRGVVRSADWWAAYDIGPVDPNRSIAEAAALYVIARDEGLASALLFKKECCVSTNF